MNIHRFLGNDKGSGNQGSGKSTIRDKKQESLGKGKKHLNKSVGMETKHRSLCLTLLHTKDRASRGSIQQSDRRADPTNEGESTAVLRRLYTSSAAWASSH